MGTAGKGILGISREEAAPLAGSRVCEREASGCSWALARALASDAGAARCRGGHCCVTAGGLSALVDHGRQRSQPTEERGCFCVWIPERRSSHAQRSGRLPHRQQEKATSSAGNGELRQGIRNLEVLLPKLSLLDCQGALLQVALTRRIAEVAVGCSG